MQQRKATLLDRLLRRDPNRCRVHEETCGLFIGRRWCTTHEIYWDGGGSCPHAGQPRRVGKL